MENQFDSIMGLNRRDFLRRLGYGIPSAAAAGTVFGGCSAGLSGAKTSQISEIPQADNATVCLVKGADRRQMIVDSLTTVVFNGLGERSQRKVDRE